MEQDSRNETAIVRFAFTVTPADAAAAYRANLRWVCTRPRFFIMSFSACLIWAVLGGYFSGGVTMLSLVPAEVLAVWCLSYWPVMYVLAPLIARRAFQQQRNLSQRWQVDLTEDRVRASTSTQDNAVAWCDYIAYSRNRQVLLLYQSDRLFQFIPALAVPTEAEAFLERKLAGVPRR